MVEALPHILLVRRSPRSSPKKKVYEDVRIAPQGELRSDLIEGTLEEYLYDITDDTSEDGAGDCNATNDGLP